MCHIYPSVLSGARRLTLIRQRNVMSLEGRTSPTGAAHDFPYPSDHPMSIPIDIPLCPSARDTPFAAASRRRNPTPAAMGPPPRASRRATYSFAVASGPPSTASRDGPSLRAEWDARRNLSSVLTDPAARRAYAAAAIREAQSSAILGKDLGWGVVFYRSRSGQHARVFRRPRLTPSRCPDNRCGRFCGRCPRPITRCRRPSSGGPGLRRPRECGAAGG